MGPGEGNQVVRLVYEKASISGIIAANVGQNFAAEALMLDINQVPLAIIKALPAPEKPSWHWRRV